MTPPRKIQVYPSTQSLESLGISSDYGPNCNLAIQAFAALIARAGADLGLDRAEWNCLADANNGIGLTLGHGGASPRAHLVANLADFQSLSGGAEKWLGKSADEKVKELLAKLQKYSDTECWSVAWSIKYFWDNCESIDQANDDWWLPSFRMMRTKSQVSAST
jgi:hypothetical protein